MKYYLDTILDTGHLRQIKFMANEAVTNLTKIINSDSMTVFDLDKHIKRTSISVNCLLEMCKMYTHEGECDVDVESLESD